MKLFTDANVVNTDSQFPRVYCDTKELVYAPPKWMQRGLQETASGYGSRLNSGYKINFNGKLYRLYTTIYGNVGSTWFKTKGRKIYVN